MKCPPAVFALLFAPVACLVAAEAAWMTDFEAARKKAVAEDKDLLMDFTGSDWCGWCIRLKKEVFSQDPFQKKVGDHFVLLEVDFPRDETKLSPETRAQNKMLGEKYGIQGYPTIILADSSGRPYAQTGYQEGGPEAYLEHLAELRKKREQRDKAFAAARDLEGVAKAKALLNAIGDFPDAVIDSFYKDIADQVAAADPEDETGFRKARDYRNAVAAYEQRMEKHFVAQDFAAAVKEADQFIADHQPSGFDKQHVLMGKAMAVVEQGDKGAALKLLDEIKAIAPESQIGSQIGMMKERVSAYLDQKNGAQPAEPQ